MLSGHDLEQNIRVILAESEQPILHTTTIASRLKIGASNTNSKAYRRVLAALHRLEKQGIVYYWYEPLTGSTWMLKLRDVNFAMPVSGRSICLGELPF